MLWEFAFANFGVYPDNETEVSADDQMAYIVALAGHPDGSKIDWEVTTRRFTRVLDPALKAVHEATHPSRLPSVEEAKREEDRHG